MDNTQAVNEQALESFVDELIKAKNSPEVTDETRAEVKQMLMNDVLQGINAHLVSLLSDEDVEHLNEMLDREATDEELNAYFTEKIPNTQDEIAKALVNFRDGYLSVDYTKDDLDDMASEPEAMESTPTEESTEQFSPPPPPPAAPVDDTETN